MSERTNGQALLALSLVFLLLAAPGCASYEPAPPPQAGTYAAYRVGAPDRLEITVLPDPTIARIATVRPDGMISFDLVGDVPASGRTVDEIAADIEKRISRFKRDAAVTVALEAALSTAISVSGEVKAPGTFPLVKQTRVAEAIFKVGGETPFASTGKIKVVRSGGGETAVYLVNLNAIRDGDLSTNIVLLAGDIVHVPPNAWAKFGYAINVALFPFQPLIGLYSSFGRGFIGM
jgi:polysaccharide export outer membrane protein